MAGLINDINGGDCSMGRFGVVFCNVVNFFSWFSLYSTCLNKGGKQAVFCSAFNIVNI